MRRSIKVMLAGGAAVLLGGGALVTVPQLLGTGEDSAGETRELGMRTATVERGSLTQGTILSGTLTRGQPLPLNANGGGVLTWLPAPGTTLRSGDRLFESNGRPTFLLYGEIPLWRPLHLGDRGKDVQSLNTALAGAGLLDKSLADDVFGQGTSSALATLFRNAGYEPPSGTEEGHKAIAEAAKAVTSAKGQLDDAEQALADASTTPVRTIGENTTEISDAETVPGLEGLRQAVADASRQVSEAAEDLAIARAEHVSPEDVTILNGKGMRVSSVPVRIGDPASGAVLQLTEVTVRAEAPVTRSQQASLSMGDTVSVTLPDGDVVPGKITSTDGGQDSASEGTDGELGEPGQEREGGTGLVTVLVAIAAQNKISDITGAAVRIEVTAASVKDALVVPVTALVALAEGGYAVEKVMPDSPPGTGTLIPVEVGLIAEARVQVSSPHLTKGDEVLIP